MIVLAETRLRRNSGDHRPELQDLQALHPEALYFAGGYLVGLRLAQQAAAILPSIHRLGAESLYNRAFLQQAGRPAAEGWYVSTVAPDLAAGLAAPWAERFRRRFGDADVPTGDSLTAYTAVTVIGDAIGRVVRSGRPLTRSALRDAIQGTRLPDAVQGPVSFDANGDLEHPLVSIYQVKGGRLTYVEALLGEEAAKPPASGGQP
jgi:branched-chain amino acid transport system substrate-binding protein